MPTALNVTGALPSGRDLELAAVKSYTALAVAGGHGIERRRDGKNIRKCQSGKIFISPFMFRRKSELPKTIKCKIFVLFKLSHVSVTFF